MKMNLKRRTIAGCTVLAAMLTIATFAAAQVETIDATARGTSTQMGGTFSVKVIVSQYSTPEDRATLVNAFKTGSNEGLVKALEKMKSAGRIQVPGRVGYDRIRENNDKIFCRTYEISGNSKNNNHNS